MYSQQGTCCYGNNLLKKVARRQLSQQQPCHAHTWFVLCVSYVAYVHAIHSMSTAMFLLCLEKGMKINCVDSGMKMDWTIPTLDQSKCRPSLSRDQFLIYIIDICTETLLTMVGHSHRKPGGLYSIYYIEVQCSRCTTVYTTALYITVQNSILIYTMEVFCSTAIVTVHVSAYCSLLLQK